VAALGVFGYRGAMKRIVVGFGLVLVVAMSGAADDLRLPAAGSSGVVAELFDDSGWIGAVLHLSQTTMLRPSVRVQFGQDTSAAIGVRADYLFLTPLYSVGDVFTYWGPSLRGYYWESTEWVDVDLVDVQNYSITAYGVFGTQVMLHPAFGVFGDVRLAVRGTYDTLSGAYRFSTYTATISVGGALYFRYRPEEDRDTLPQQ
jgi:hypothetical protein